MPSYYYRARRPDGKLAQGTLRAGNEERAAHLLRQNQLTPIAIKQADQKSFLERDIIAGRVNTKDLILFSRQSSAMIRAGVPIIESLASIEKQSTKSRLSEVLREMIYDIEAGESLSSTMAKHPKAFSPFMLGIVRTGEASGRLAQSLETTADYLERDYVFVRKVRAALVYPVFVVSIVIILSLIMFTFVLPQLVSLFEESGVILPLPTRILINTTQVFSTYWYVFVALAVTLGIIVRSYLKTPEGVYNFNTLLLKIPILSSFFQKVYLSRLTSILDTLFASDVPVIESLELARQAISNQVYQRILQDTIDAIKDGSSISNVWKNEVFIPPILTSMISVGERSGEIQKGLKEANRFFQRDVDDILNGITTLLEPILILVLGAGVGVVVAAVLLPIYNLVLVL